MRYFNIEQRREPKSMFSGERLADILELEKTAKEITEQQAKEKPSWGSGNKSVNKTYKFVKAMLGEI